MDTQPAQFRPTCKVCDRGELVPQKVFRMSGPVVAIGFILLIPSILGMIVAALMFFGVFAYNGENASNSSVESALTQSQDYRPRPDDNNRSVCATAVIESVQRESGALPTLSSVVQTCECAVGAMKQGTFTSDTTDACAKRSLHGDFPPPDHKTEFPYVQVYKSYSDPLGYQDALARAKTPDQATTQGVSWFRLFGGTFAIFIGIASFVGGLLGWLLVMRKRVLKCSLCGATVSA